MSVCRLCLFYIKFKNLRHKIFLIIKYDRISAHRSLYFRKEDRFWRIRKSQMYQPPHIEARHDLTGVKVAVKILNKRKMKNKNMISKVKSMIKR